MTDRLRIFLRSNAIYLILGAYFIAGLLTIFFFDGTGDNGDSITHYLYARYAPVHPRLYLDHWAKPLFVLLSSPFARFGFNGMKVFNLLMAVLTAYFTWLSAVRLGIRNALLSVVFLVFTPLYYILTFSGLTEPMFAFSLILGIYLAISERYLAAALVVSFMPFIRSEGLIILGMFACWFLLKKQWKYLPWLLAGHLAYSVAGCFFYHDFLWIFNKLPYASLEHKYGSGPLSHFVIQLTYVIGIPLYVLLCLGILGYTWRMIRKKDGPAGAELFLVLFIFLAYLAAHSLFWFLGIFNSMGMKRVLLGVVPLISLIALRGFNLVTCDLFPGKKVPGMIAGGLLLTYLVVFPFTRNPAAIRWSQDMKLTNEQKAIREAAAYIRTHPSAPGHRLFYTHPYFAEAMNTDYFDSLEHTGISVPMIRSGDRVIWDSWFSVVESRVPLETLMDLPGMKKEAEFSATDRNREVRFVILHKE